MTGTRSVTLTAAGVAAVVGTIGADSRWLAALGRTIADQRAIPQHIPYAEAPTAGWHNALALAELLFAAVYVPFGDHGLLVVQVAAVAAAFALVATDARAAGAADASITVALLFVLLGSLGAVTVVRLQLFSLVLFPLLLVLLRRDRRRPSPRIWLLVPLLGVWANLHGGVVVAAGVAALYLVIDRARKTPVEGLGVLVCSLGAMLLTPALLQTPSYFHSLLTNVAAREKLGLWAAPSLHRLTDVLMLVAAVALATAALRRRLPLWELAAAVALAFLTARAARSGIWLVFLLATPAGVGLGLRRGAGPHAATVVAALATVMLAVGLATAPSVVSETRLVRLAIRTADGRPVLADAALAEEVAAEGGRVWIANPLDAFSPADQRLWLHWLQGWPSGDGARSRADVVLVSADNPARKRVADDRRFRRVAADAHASLYVRYE